MKLYICSVWLGVKETKGKKAAKTKRLKKFVGSPRQPCELGVSPNRRGYYKKLLKHKRAGL